MKWVAKLLTQKLLGIKTPFTFNMERSSNHLFYPHQHFQPAFPTHLTENSPYQMPYDPPKSLLSCKALLGSSESWSQPCHTIPPLWIKAAHVESLWISYLSGVMTAMELFAQQRRKLKTSLLWACIVQCSPEWKIKTLILRHLCHDLVMFQERSAQHVSLGVFCYALFHRKRFRPHSWIIHPILKK